MGTDPANPSPQEPSLSNRTRFSTIILPLTDNRSYGRAGFSALASRHTRRAKCCLV